MSPSGKQDAGQFVLGRRGEVNTRQVIGKHRVLGSILVEIITWKLAN